MSNASTPFRPFETNFDQDCALKTLQDTVAGAEDGEMFLERHRSEALVFDDGRVKMLVTMHPKVLDCARLRVKLQDMHTPHR